MHACMCLCVFVRARARVCVCVCVRGVWCVRAGGAHVCVWMRKRCSMSEESRVEHLKNMNINSIC